MKRDAEIAWTIDELGAETARALSVDYEGPPNERVREIPDLRTIRYYTTLGLIDRPLGLRGRTALYGRRHLLQLVAIKRLQASGRTLADVQRHLVGLTDAALERLARLPQTEPAAHPGERTAARGTGRRPSSSFWKAQPAAAAPGKARSEMTAQAAEPDHARQSPSLPHPAARPLQGVRLHADLTLLVVSERHLDHDDMRAIHAAARPLIQELESRALIRPREEREPT
jgi:DNA-binding transcriptional MerR regulator